MERSDRYNNPFSTNLRLKRETQRGSRRVKVEIRRLKKQELTEDEVLEGVRVLKEAIKNKEKQ